MSDSNGTFEIPEPPEGWASSVMGALAQVVGGGTPDSKDATNFTEDGGRPWLTPADLSGFQEIYVHRGARNLTAKGLARSSAKLMPRGTVLMSSRAPIGYVAVAANEICTNQGFKSFICSAALQPEFVHFWLKFVRPKLEEMGSGSTFAELSGARAKEIPIVVAPLAEQRRIVEKVESLLEQTNRAKRRLDRVPLILKRFRQAVLAAACSGKLTEEWRGGRGELQIGITALLKQLETLPAPDTGGPELPDTWAWVPFAKTVDNHDGRRVPVKSSDREKRRGKYPYYGASGVIDAIDDFLFDGDFLLIAEDGANLLSRTTPIAFPASGRFWANNHAHVVQPKQGVMLQYLEAHLNSIDLQGYVTGTAQPKLTQGALNMIPVALPPTAEQAEIVRRADRLFALADAIERRIQAAAARAGRLPQSILAKAFSGELVPTEAQLARQERRRYESASALLQRVRREAGLETEHARGVKGTKRTHAPKHQTEITPSTRTDRARRCTPSS
jgi:type I restriction enzyme, S subunit